MITYTPVSDRLLCFALCNVGAYGDQFLISPSSVDLSALQPKLVGNNPEHTTNLGHEYCRVFASPGGRLCWTYNYITMSGESVGRRGIVYVFGFVFEPELFLEFKNTLFALFYSFVCHAHEVAGQQGGTGQSIEALMESLNDPERENAHKTIKAFCEAIVTHFLWLNASVGESRWGRKLIGRLRHFASRILLPRSGVHYSYIVHSASEMTRAFVLDMFNKEVSRLVYRLLLSGRGVSTWGEFDTDNVIHFVSVPNLPDAKLKVYQGRTSQGSAYAIVRAQAGRHLAESIPEPR